MRPALQRLAQAITTEGDNDNEEHEGEIRIRNRRMIG
jgi:hypothetical protein